jgi:hypothetical protein
MRRIYSALIVIPVVLVFTGCAKNKTNDFTGSESELYGVWVKGPNPGDTLEFMRKNNKNIMRRLELFNAGIPTYSEREYRYQDGKFGAKYYSSADDFYQINSFAWTQAGREFTLLAFQLLPIISSTTTWYTYRKI